MALIVCKECKKEYSDTLEACPHCGYKALNGVTIHGYTEVYANNPIIDILKDGLLVGRIGKNDSIKLKISEPCKIRFKWKFRTAECFTRPGDHIILSFNRLTGHLEAFACDEKGLHTEMAIIKGKDSQNKMRTIMLSLGLGFLAFLIWLIGWLAQF